jgi:SAM-dependent methyltransferase
VERGSAPIRGQALEQWLAYSVRRAQLDRDLAVVAPYMRGRVLEIGAGRRQRRGEFLPPVDRCKSWTFFDRDLSRRPDVVGDVQRSPFAQGVFDSIVCLEVLQYVESPQAALREACRMLTPAGTLIITTPFLHRADTREDYWRFTEFGLKRLLSEAGFAVVHFVAQAGALGVAVNILKYAVYVHRAGWRRRIFAQAGRPVLSWLWRHDGSTSAEIPTLDSFSTGYLAVAKPAPETRGLS